MKGFLDYETKTVHFAPGFDDKDDEILLKHFADTIPQENRHEWIFSSDQGKYFSSESTHPEAIDFLNKTRKHHYVNSSTNT